MNDKRYLISGYVGPCSEKEVEAFASAIIDLVEADVVGLGGVGIEVIEDLPDD